MITSYLDLMTTNKANGVNDLAPSGSVLAFNNSIALGEEGYIILNHYGDADCLSKPAACSNGFSVSLWARNTWFITAEEEADQGLKYLLS